MGNSPKLQNWILTFRYSLVLYPGHPLSGGVLPSQQKCSWRVSQLQPTWGWGDISNVQRTTLKKINFSFFVYFYIVNIDSVSKLLEHTMYYIQHLNITECKFQIYIHKNWITQIVCESLYKKDLALNNLQWLICHKTQTNSRSLSNLCPWKKALNCFTFTAILLHSNINVFLQGWLCHEITHRGWYAIKQISQTKPNLKKKVIAWFKTTFTVKTKWNLQKKITLMFGRIHMEFFVTNFYNFLCCRNERNWRV